MLGVIWTRFQDREESEHYHFDGVKACPLNWPQVCIVLGCCAILYAGLTLIAQGLNLWKPDRDQISRALITITFQGFLSLAFLSLVRFFLHLDHQTWGEAFGFRATRWRNTLGTALTALIAIPFPIFLAIALTRVAFEQMGWNMEPQPIMKFLLDLKDPHLKWTLILMAVLVAPVTEELLFRGLLYPHLKAKLGRHALWITSAVFAAFHLHLPSLLPLFVLAMGFNLLYEWRGNLAAPILMHAGFNAFSLTMLFFRGNAT